MRHLRWVAAAAVVAAIPLGAQAQSLGTGSPPTVAPQVPPNSSGTVNYRNSGGTETTPGGTTVFHGTGSSTTITFDGSATPSNTGLGTGGPPVSR
jgi:hypothetical protein